MVLKRQLPSRVSPDEAAKPSASAAAPVANIDEQWPAPPESKTPAQTAILNTLPDLPPLPPLPEETPVQQAAPVTAPEAPAVAAAPSEPADTTPSLPSDDTPRRRVKAPRAFTETAPAPEAGAAMPAPQPVKNPIAEAPDRLADAGIIPAQNVDTLTSGLQAAPPSFSAPLPASQPLPATNIFETPAEPAAAPVASAAPEAPAAMPAPAPQPAVPAQSLPEPTSDLPWATGPAKAAESTSSGWDIETPAVTAAPTVASAAAAPAAPPPDLFRDVALSRTAGAEGPIPSMPWSNSPGRSAPELPKTSMPSPATPRGGSFQLVLAAAAVAGVLFVAYTLVTRTDSTQERLARLTGSLREAPEVVPGSPASTNPAVQPNLQPEKVIAMGNISGSNLLPPPAVAANTFMPLEPTTPAGSPSTVVDFTDVPPGEAGKPIVADGTEKMPADVGYIASLQQAIAKEKAKEGGKPAAIQAAEASKADDKNLSQVEKLKRGEDLKAQLDEELASYRKALAEAPAPALAPKPTEFFREPSQFMDGKNQLGAATGASGTLLPPPNSGAAPVKAAKGVEGLPPAELYANNPKNLPILPEPAVEAPKVRQLADFDVNVFTPEEPKVRMPKGVKPRIAAGDFPSLDILSLVPGRGLIAYYEGKEGVLMVGEQVAGWKLVGVNATTAEFASGEKHQVVRAD
ncbi:MAG TPA: hypothetical protein VHP58_02855 [Alphaproteobacteria bacterium]|nr:hypothetical protein [Alphaproteobacteria bacterium]